MEHAAWTKGSRHLQPLRDDLSWFQTKSLGVIMFLAVTVSAILAVLGVVLLVAGKALLRLLQRQGLLTHAKTA